MWSKISVLAILLLAPTFLWAREAFIIVPGTWSTSSTWHLPGGAFFKALNASAAKLKLPVITFVWSGKNSHAARTAAAQKLADLIAEYDHVHLVTHSHGSNVGILASQLLGTHHHIKNFFAMATPVSTNFYFPNMDAVCYFFNFFSLGDTVQPVFGLFERTFPSHERIANIRVTIDGQSPSHSGIHNPLVANFLPLLATGLPFQKIPQLFTQPGLLHFSYASAPHYEVDTEQQNLIDLEQLLLTIATIDRKLNT